MPSLSLSLLVPYVPSTCQCKYCMVLFQIPIFFGHVYIPTSLSVPSITSFGLKKSLFSTFTFQFFGNWIGHPISQKKRWIDAKGPDRSKASWCLWKRSFAPSRQTWWTPWGTSRKSQYKGRKRRRWNQGNLGWKIRLVMRQQQHWGLTWPQSCSC